MRVYETEVLVVGGGGAGAMAAIHASHSLVDVIVTIKGKINKSGATPMAMGAASAVGSWHTPDDSQDIHLKDTIKGGAYLNDQKMVRALVEEAPLRVLELERYGAFWERTEDGAAYLLRVDGGHSYPRSIYLEDRPGHEMLRAIRGELIKRNVNMVENVMVTRLLTRDSAITGACGIDMITGEFVLFKTKAVIIATGGAGQIYPYTSQDSRNTGDGYALALEAGADLADMEFVQFFPIGLLFPDSMKGLIVGAMYYSHLLNKNMERLMEKYDPQRLELSTRDIVSRGVFTEIIQGRATPRGGMWCDMTYNPPGFIKRQLPLVYNLCEKIGANPEKDMLEVAPTCHFYMGGVRVDEHWRSSLNGLFAAGEAAGGAHGANRLSQNSLADILVTGARAGRAASQYCKNTDSIKFDTEQVNVEKSRIDGLLDASPEKGLHPFTIKKKIKQIMWEKSSIFRDGKGLEDALKEIIRIKEEDIPHIAIANKSPRFNKELIDALEANCMLTVAESIIRPALHRKESRGAHYRHDFPSLDNRNWLKHISVRLTNKGFELDTYPVDLSEISPEV